MRTARFIGNWFTGLLASSLAAILLWQWVTFALSNLDPRTPPVLFLWLALGLNLTIWSTVGVIRLADDSVRALTSRARGRHAAAAAEIHESRRARVLEPAGGGPAVPAVAGPANGAGGEEAITLAVVIAAHNEEPVINAAIRSALRLFPRQDIYVVSDSSADATAHIAAETGVNVLELLTNRGKAGALEALITEFRLTERYHAVVILDADTELDANYVTGVRRQLRDPSVAAVAGFVVTDWNPEERSLIGRAIAAYRDRLYFLLQYLMRYGQTWRWTSVSFIVPGFASCYRSTALRQIDVNPTGLVIEDFNMTFEVHRRKLGRIAMHPNTLAVCQDPYTMGDYVSQVRRWGLGFWQTVRRHGIWPSLFCFALFFYILEIVLVAVVLLIACALLVVTVLPAVTNDAVLQLGWYAAVYDPIAGFLPWTVLAIGLFIPDYILTCIMVVFRRRPGYLIYGLFFMLFRVIDSFLNLRTIPLAWTSRSDGQWRSPRRALRS